MCARVQEIELEILEDPRGRSREWVLGGTVERTEVSAVKVRSEVHQPRVAIAS
jgi:hypothetical protein